MKQKQAKAKTLSWLLVFSMVIGLLSGFTTEKKEVNAAITDAKIAFGNAVPDASGEYYTYPDVKVEYDEPSTSEDPAQFRYLTITVDSGYFQISAEANSDMVKEGWGILYESDMSSQYSAINTSNHYSAAYFDFMQSDVEKQDIENFIKKLRFTTEPGLKQKVSICTTVKGNIPDTLTVGDKDVVLHYFNGHYYGYVPFDTDDFSWAEAYRESKTLNIPGTEIYGYLATLTSKAEDRFILYLSPSYTEGYAKEGWIGCTRAKLANGSSYTSETTRWQPLDKFDSNTCQENFIWRWVSGPEAGTSFGYQNHAFGDEFQGDGGFVVENNQFQNWEKSNSNTEPNGGSFSDEAYGYFGKYKYGRWNDAKNSGGYEYGIFGYYIEFGGQEGDDREFEKLGQVTITGNSDDTEGSTGENITTATQAPPTKLEGAPVIKNTNQDANGENINEVGTVLIADVSGVIPDDSHDTLTYQWYIEGAEDTILATTPTFTLTEDTLNKNIIVKVKGNEKYTGELPSAPYPTTVTTVKEEKIPIAGQPVIVNETKDDSGYPINKEGAVFTAELNKITPIGSHDYLNYQWYYVDYYENDGKTPHLVPISGATEKSYILTSDILDKIVTVSYDENGNPILDDKGNPTTLDKVQLYVTATAKSDSPYTGEVTSNPYNATRTNAGISVGGKDDDPNIPQEIKDALQDGQRVLIINPTVDKTIYGIKDESGKLLNDTLIAKDQNGNDVKTTDDYVGCEGYYDPEPNDTLYIIVDADKNYIIHEVKRPDTTKEENTEIISTDIPDSSIHTEGDNKNTPDTSDDTISIIIDPAKEDYKYAVLKKVDGKYVEVAVTKDANGNYIPDANSTTPWSDSKEKKVVFTNLPADGTYKIVAVSASDAADTSIKELTPDQITGGSNDIHVTVPAYTAPTTTPPASNPTGGSIFTPAELDAAATFVKEHATDPKGNIITVITDITRDIITSGEAEWNKMTENEKAAVNAKLKENGCPYTYDELLKMAKKYKIPGFKLRKVMKKGSKANLKLVKCKGATIVCTTTNKKIATVSKKGVIKAKKVGSATLTITASKGKNTNRLVVKIIVRKKFKNAKELKKFKSNKIKTPTILIAKKRKLKKSTKLKVYDLEKSSKVTFKAFNKKVLKLTKKGKYTGKKKGSSLVRVTVKQNKKKYLLYVYVSIFK